jgi:hypothetical protein
MSHPAHLERFTTALAARQDVRCAPAWRATVGFARLPGQLMLTPRDGRHLSGIDNAGGVARALREAPLTGLWFIGELERAAPEGA